MRILLFLIGIPLLAETVNFDTAAAGSLPAGWTSAMTHKGGAPGWEVRKDPTAPSQPNVLAQLSSDPTGARFPLAIADRWSFTDGEIGVKCKSVAGKGDQACGVVWRYRDPDNYYIARANALEDNVVLYKVEKSSRVSIAPKGTPSKTYGVKHKVPSQTWNTLRVTFAGNHFEVFFNGQKLFEAEDSTFTGPGKTGLWTKADSVTYFDDFQIVPK